MKRRADFKTVYLCITAVLLLVCTVCVINVHFILKDYESSQPENVVLARMDAAKGHPLSELMDTSGLSESEITAAEKALAGDLSCKLKKSIDGGTSLTYTVSSEGSDICDVTLKSGETRTKLTIFNLTDWSVVSITPPSFDCTLKLPSGLSVFADGTPVSGTLCDDGLVLFDVSSKAEPTITLRDVVGNSVVYDGKSGVSATSYTVNLPSNMKIVSYDGAEVSLTPTDSREISEYRYVSEYATMPTLLTYKLPLISGTNGLRIVDSAGAEVAFEEKDHVITASLVSSADALPDGMCQKDHVLAAAETWSLFMTADLGGNMHGFDTVAQYLVPDSYLYGVAKDWATGVDITFTSVHTLNVNPFSTESVKNFTVYGDDCFSCDVYLTKIMHLNSGNDVTDVLNSRFYFVKRGDSWLVADIIEIIDRD